MVVPMSDHLCTRGDAVFDTAIIIGGAVYMLEEHLDRLEASASAVGLCLPGGGRPFIRDALLATAAASGVRDGALRYWLSSGPGGFGVARPKRGEGVGVEQQAPGSAFYAVAVEPLALAVPQGVSCAVVPHIPPKPAPFCSVRALGAVLCVRTPDGAALPTPCQVMYKALR